MSPHTLAGYSSCSFLTQRLGAPLQIDPIKYKSIGSGFGVLYAEQGIGGFFKGWLPTLLGYSAQGACKFGFYEFFKKYYSDLAGEEYAHKYKTLIYLAGSASAEFIADLALCPFEAVKVRVQTKPGFANGLMDGMPKLIKADGVGGLYKGLTPLWGRQIPYTMMKFACFEETVAALYKYVVPYPKSECSKSTQLGVSFAAGYIAGVFCAIVSHPADNLVSFLNNAKGATVGQAVQQMGWVGLFTRGLPLRIIMIGTLTGAQWGIYDAFKISVGLPTTGAAPPPVVEESTPALPNLAQAPKTQENHLKRVTTCKGPLASARLLQAASTLSARTGMSPTRDMDGVALQTLDVLDRVWSSAETLGLGLLAATAARNPRLPPPRAAAAAGIADVLAPALEPAGLVTPHAEEEEGDARRGELDVSGDSIRRRFLRFFEARGHTVMRSSSLVPDDPTVLLTIAGMLQFKPIFLGQVPRKVPRATTSQKCVRTNDVENVGMTARHHTFFEMLGNFSFGDYFKREAIQWAWELATTEFRLPVERIWISVYEDDDEAFAIWRDEVGVSTDHIKRMGAEDNFWASGATGPCGPCSEMYYDFHPELGVANTDLGDDSRFIEFYNLVFMQYNRSDDGKLEPLKNMNIDTGLGLERMAQILQKVPNNYETDLIFPIIQKASQLAGVEYASASKKQQGQLKVIGDHTRAVVYLISDGVVPSNAGRGYVVRRLIRRVVRMSRQLGISGPDAESAFLPSIAEAVINMSSQVDPDVQKNALRIYSELKREELRFVQTLERGERLLDQLLEGAQLHNGKAMLSGKDAFMLYDTFGFPVEITEEVARERGVEVDMAGFVEEMELQRKQAQAAHSTVKLAVGSVAADLAGHIPKTEFVGYTNLKSKGTITALLRSGKVVEVAEEGQDVDVVLDKTPFYAESGGQIGDQGLMEIEGQEGRIGILRVRDVQKVGGDLWMHTAKVEEGTARVGCSVSSVVDTKLRRSAQAHHTATHLLQAALKQVVGPDVSQAGSLVGFDRLRFDFNCPRGLTQEEVGKIEAMINEWIGEAVPLDWTVMPLAEAKASGAIAMFGEKYGDEVRVVKVPGVSMELCGGTHVGNTAEIRGLKIVSEAGIASGVRRVEAVAGPAFVEYLSERDNVVKHLCNSLKAKPEEVPVRVSGLQEDLKAARNEACQLRGMLALMKAEGLADSAVQVDKHGTKVLVHSLGDVDADSLKLAAERLLERLGDPAAVILGSCPGDGKVSLVAAFSQQVVKSGLQAGKFVGSIAKLCGGGGGGRPNFAQAGGKQPEKLGEALEQGSRDLMEALDRQDASKS
eukprot:SM000007S20807  [mRNA]  locus=s7:361029:373582:+ [translate_table: standard]